ncbi:MAG: DUF4115 domain-containing protein, partial [Anaerolineae bacterium]|nr:DUF4115 domain-containing protein [Anaerolineae bacterium]
ETSPGTEPLLTPTSPLAGDGMQDDGGLLAGNETSAPDQQTPTPTTGEVSAPATAIYTPPTLTGSNIALVIEITQSTWVRVIADGMVVYESQADVGEILNYTAESSINVRATNAAGLQLTVNNQPQGTVGARGELFDQTYTLNGVAPPIGAQPPDGDTAAVPASPAEATFVFTPTATLRLDSGNGEAFDPLAPFSMTPSAIETPTSTVILTATPTPSPPALPTATATATVTVTPTVTTTYTPTPTPSGTYTAQPTATPSYTPTATQTSTSTPTATPTATPTPTSTPTATATHTPTPTFTPTPTPTATWTPTFTLTWTPSPTWSATPSYTPTFTLTPTATPFLPPRETRTPTPSAK